MLKKTYKKIVSEKTRIYIRRSVQRSCYPLYLGNKVYCNCCGKSFRKFLPYGNVKRDNAKCPYCFSFERTRVLDLYLQNELTIYDKENLNILHFAPEPSLYKKIKRLNHTYIDADLNAANARNVVDITTIPYDDNHFDLIICSHVLGHVPDENKALTEMHRVLKPDGVVLIMSLMNLSMEETLEKKSMLTPQERLSHYGESDLCRLYGQDHCKRIERVDFKVEMIDYRKQLPKEIQDKNFLGDGSREIIFNCVK